VFRLLNRVFPRVIDNGKMLRNFVQIMRPRKLRKHGSNGGIIRGMSDRKYRQRGYMDQDREPQRPKPQSKPAEREGPRSPKMMAYGETVKCSSCGAKVTTAIGGESCCQTCKAELHTCRQCTYFDPSARFECSKPVTARIVNKNARNTCELFTPRTVVERQTSSGAPNDARAAFAKLFKK
jgi:hypothetical protein